MPQPIIASGRYPLRGQHLENQLLLTLYPPACFTTPCLTPCLMKRRIWGRFGDRPEQPRNKQLASRIMEKKFWPVIAPSYPCMAFRSWGTKCGWDSFFLLDRSDGPGTSPFDEGGVKEGTFVLRWRDAVKLIDCLVRPKQTGWESAILFA